MKLFRNVKLSTKALIQNRMRTVFSVIGVGVGIAAVMITSGISQGAKEKSMAPIKAMGSNVIVVSAGKVPEMPGRKQQFKFATSLKLADSAGLKNIRYIKQWSPFQEISTTIGYQGIFTTGLIQGVMPSYFSIRNYILDKGACFDSSHNVKSERVAVLGAQMADKLFEQGDPVGRVIYINKIPFTVKGTLKEKGSVSEMGNIDNVVIIPVQTLLRRVLNIDFLSKYYLQANNRQHLEAAESIIVNNFRDLHQLNVLNKENDFTIINQINAIRAAEATSKDFDYLITGTFLVSLLIGGGAISVIMILSVRERINEIGLRISVGAKKTDILLQFLTESLILGISGGIFGMATGLLASHILSNFSEWTVVLSAQMMVDSVLFSMLAGIVFGVLPALKASFINPVLALKGD